MRVLKVLFSARYVCLAGLLDSLCTSDMVTTFFRQFVISIFVVCHPLDFKTTSRSVPSLTFNVDSKYVFAAVSVQI